MLVTVSVTEHTVLGSLPGLSSPYQLQTRCPLRRHPHPPWCSLLSQADSSTFLGFSLLLAISSLVSPFPTPEFSVQKLGPGHKTLWLKCHLWITLAQRLLNVINRIWKQVDMSPKVVLFIQIFLLLSSRGCATGVWRWLYCLSPSSYSLQLSSASGRTDLKQLWRVNLLKPLIYSTQHTARAQWT